MRLLMYLSLTLITASCGSAPSSPSSTDVSGPRPNVAARSTSAAPTYGYEIVNTYPHDAKAFTQGLAFRDGFLYESTGELGRSSLRKVELATGKVVQKYNLPPEVFGEGMTILDDKIYQFSWQNGQAWEYNLADFTLLREMNYAGEGWGMTNDGTNLITSDGTHLLRFVDPKTFKTIRTIPVIQNNGKPVFLLNELEWVKGEIWANIWHSEDDATDTQQGKMPNIRRPKTIVRIDPATGSVLGWIDLAGLSPQDQNDQVETEKTLNGIAYDAVNDRIFVTGKNWKKLYEIKVIPK